MEKKKKKKYRLLLLLWEKNLLVSDDDSTWGDYAWAVIGLQLPVLGFCDLWLARFSFV